MPLAASGISVSGSGLPARKMHPASGLDGTHVDAWASEPIKLITESVSQTPTSPSLFLGTWWVVGGWECNYVFPRARA